MFAMNGTLSSEVSSRHFQCYLLNVEIELPLQTNLLDKNVN